MKGWLIIGAICLALCVFLYTCDPGVKPLRNLEDRSLRSLIIDSIQGTTTEAINKKSDSLVFELKKKDSIQSAKIKTLQRSYNKQRLIIKHLTAIRVDSTKQVVNNVPIEEYNALIHSNAMCDSLLVFLDLELAIKDSIISTREIQVENLIKKVETGEIAQADLVALQENLKKRLKRCQNQNKVLKITALIAILSNFLH